MGLEISERLDGDNPRASDAVRYHRIAIEVKNNIGILLLFLMLQARAKGRDK